MFDSGWLKALKQAGLPFYLVILFALACIAAIRRIFTWPAPFANGWVWVDIAAIAALSPVLLIVLYKSISYIINLIRKIYNIQTVKYKLKLLNKDQSRLIRMMLERNSRHIEMEVGSSRVWWFEEMKENGLIEHQDQLIIVPDLPIPYAIPIEIWKIILNNKELFINKL